MAEEVRVDLLVGRETLAPALKRTADTSALAARGAGLLTDMLARQRKAVDASVGATLTLAKADAILAEAEDELSGKAELARRELARQGEAAQDASRKTAEAGAAAGAAGGGFGALSSGMGAAIAGGVALSPVLAVLATGAAGLGLAAAGLAKDQRLMAQTLAPLKRDYKGFQAVLKPVLLQDFAAATGLASTGLHAILPVSKEVGKGLGALLGSVDKELQSGRFQQFFAWLAKQAAPDMAQLTSVVTHLLGALPPLLQSLQPLASEALTGADNVAVLITRLAQLANAAESANGHLVTASDGTQKWAQSTSLLGGATHDAWKNLTTHLIPGLSITSKWGLELWHKVTGAGGAVKTFGTQVSGTRRPVAKFTGDVKAAALALSANLGGQLGFNASVVQSYDDLARLRQALKSSGGQVGLFTQKQRDSFAAANSYIGDLQQMASAALKSGHGAGSAAQAIHAGLPTLEKAAAHNKALRQELQLLKDVYDRLKRERSFHQAITITASGALTGRTPGVQKVLHSFGLAAGWRVPGYGGGDRVPAVLEPGEAVVPKHLVPEMAPWARMRGIPGFAEGGYIGGAAGLGRWLGREVPAARGALTGLFGAAMLKELSALMSAGAGGALGGSVRGWLAAALGIDRAPMSWMPAELQLVRRESGGNPRAWNPVSVLGEHASGLMQMLPSTFASWALPGMLDIWNPVDNAVSSVRYQRATYGSPWNIPNLFGSGYQGYGKGGLVRGYADGGLVVPSARAWSVGAIPKTERVPAAVAGSSLLRAQAVIHAAVAALQKHEAGDYAGLRHAFRVSFLGAEHTPKWLRAHKHGGAAAWAAAHPAARAWLHDPRHRRWVTADLEHLARLQERETAAFKTVMGGDATVTSLAALGGAAAAEARALRHMGALSRLPGGHPGWVSGVEWWLRGLRRAAGAGRTALGAQFHVYDSGGWLPPGVTMAVNRTSRPEMVVPAGRGGAAVVNNFHIDVKVAPGAHPAETGRQVASALNEYFRGGGKISNGRGRSFP